MYVALCIERETFFYHYVPAGGNSSMITNLGGAAIQLRHRKYWIQMKTTVDHLILTMLSFTLVFPVGFVLFCFYLGCCRARPLLALVERRCWARKDMAWLEGLIRSPETLWCNAIPWDTKMDKESEESCVGVKTNPNTEYALRLVQKIVIKHKIVLIDRLMSVMTYFKYIKQSVWHDFMHFYFCHLPCCTRQKWWVFPPCHGGLGSSHSHAVQREQDIIYE